MEQDRQYDGTMLNEVLVFLDSMRRDHASSVDMQADYSSQAILLYRNMAKERGLECSEDIGTIDTKTATTSSSSLVAELAIPAPLRPPPILRVGSGAVGGYGPIAKRKYASLVSPSIQSVSAPAVEVSSTQPLGFVSPPIIQVVRPYRPVIVIATQMQPAILRLRKLYL